MKQSRALHKFFIDTVDPLILGGHTKLSRWIASCYTTLIPRDHHAWVLLARCHGAFGDFEGEEVVLRRGLEKIHDSDYLLGRLAGSLIAQNRFEEAQQILERMKDAFPDSTYTWTWAAILAARRDDIDETRHAVDEAIEHLKWDGPSLPATADCCGLLADVLIAKLHEVEEARDLLARVFDTRIRNAGVPLTLGVLKEIHGDPDSGDVLDVARVMWRGSADSFESALSRERAQLERALS